MAPLTENALAAALCTSQWPVSHIVCGTRAELVARRILWSHDAKTGKPTPMFGALKVAVDPRRDPDDWELF